MATVLALALGLGACELPEAAPRRPGFPRAESTASEPAASARTSARLYAEPRVAMALTPHVDEHGEVTRVNVALTLDHDALPMGEDFKLMAPAHCAGDREYVHGIHELSARDQRGMLVLSSAIAKDADDRSLWYADRLARGTVHVQYVVQLPKANATSVLGLRAEGGALMSSGCSLLLLPQATLPVHAELHWNLSGMPPASRAATSFGMGDLDRVVSTSDLRLMRILVGPLESTSDARAMWVGAPGFDMKDAIAFRNRADDTFARFFDTPVGKHGTFLAQFQSSAWSPAGEAFADSFLLVAPPKGPFTARMRTTIDHELIHRWIGGEVLLRDGVSYCSWFTEGFTVYYARELALRAGLIDANEFAEDVRAWATTYFFIAPREPIDATELETRRWSDPAAQYLPYGRGSFFAAEMDAAIRKRSGGKRSLDHVMSALLAEARTAKPTAIGYEGVQAARLRALLVAEAGPDAGKRFDDVIVHGALARPPSDAFGPCFRSAESKARTFELGFDWRSLEHSPKRAKGVVKSGPAYAAGLREGDEILELSSSSATEKSKATELRLRVKRAGVISAMRYEPFVAATMPLGWARAPGVADAACVRREGNLAHL